ATLDASALNATTSGGTGVGVTLAFNSIGWKPQNILFNTVDAVIGDPAISSAFGGEVPSGATAYIDGGSVGASGQVTVGATSDDPITSTVQNQADVSAGGFSSANGASFGIVVAQNKVSGKAQAYVTGASVGADGGLDVQATDSSSITASISLDTSAAAE